MRYITLPNPLWSAQLQILGGLNRMIWLSLFYAAVLVGGILLFRLTVDEMSAVEYADRALKILAGLQCLVLLAGGAGAIGRALQRDNATRMVESHRAAPMSAFTVVVGYIVGPCQQVAVLFVVGLLMGLGLAMLARASPGGWLAGNLCLLTVAWSLWSAAVFFSMTAVKRAPFSGALLVAAGSARAWMELLPALGLFSGLTSVLWCFSVMVGRTPSHRGLAVVILINVLMGLYWVVVSVRRFRWPQLAPLTPRAAWCLAVIWLVVSTLGLMRPDYNLGWGGGEPDLNALATLFATMALGALPCLMAVHEQRRTVIRCSGLDLRQWLRPWFWVAAGAGVVLAQAWSIGRLSPSSGAAAAWASRPVLMAILPLLGTLMACAVGRLLYFLLVRHSPAAVLLCALWVGPPALNFFYMAHQGVQIDPAHLSWVGTSSPLGAIVVLWYGAESLSAEDALPGRADDAAQRGLPLSLRAGPAIGAVLTLLAWLAGSQVLQRFVQRRQALR